MFKNILRPVYLINNTRYLRAICQKAVDKDIESKDDMKEYEEEFKPRLDYNHEMYIEFEDFESYDSCCGGGCKPCEDNSN